MKNENKRRHTARTRHSAYHGEPVHQRDRVFGGKHGEHGCKSRMFAKHPAEQSQWQDFDFHFCKRLDGLVGGMAGEARQADKVSRDVKVCHLPGALGGSQAAGDPAGAEPIDLRIGSPLMAEVGPTTEGPDGSGQGVRGS